MSLYFPEYVEFTLDRLEKYGFSAYLVGGCVRDFVMGICPHDYDITTNATPDEILCCFPDVKCLDVGKKHGTITLVFEDYCVEVTTYRIDGEYKDSRHPESVTFTDKIQDDLSRRDFTMNAIAYSPVSGFVDPFDGRGDIENGRIVCVGEPEKRFEEDALRILRAMRFSSRLGFEIEEKTKKAIFEKKHLLCNIATERINGEFLGILDGEYFCDVIFEYLQVVQTFIPSLVLTGRESYVRAGDFCRTVKLSLLFSYCTDASMLASILKQLKFDNNTVKNVVAVVSMTEEYFCKTKDADIKRAAAKIGVENTKILYRVLYCIKNDTSCLDAVDKLCAFVDSGECISISSLDVRGNEIIEEYSINPSDTGKILSHLFDDVVEGVIPNEKTALLKRAKHHIKQISKEI